ncbi:LysM receptor kinase K1B, partial [Trifolium medium]|nr:LysM receptor kinase K1B [Trifolium medium]
IADFGMTKLSDVASSTDNTDHVVGTFGYMPPEYDEFCSSFYVFDINILGYRIWKCLSYCHRYSFFVPITKKFSQY